MWSSRGQKEAALSRACFYRHAIVIAFFHRRGKVQKKRGEEWMNKEASKNGVNFRASDPRYEGPSLAGTNSPGTVLRL